MFCTERYGIIEASTKSGKTVSAISWIVEQTLMGKPFWNHWWVAPGYNQAEIAYRRIKQSLTKGAFTAFDTPTPRICMINQAWIWFKSADNSDALYGEDVYSAVIDEASRVQEPSWHAVRSTLTATRGPVRIIGNVKGRKNWFYDLARKAEVQMLEQPNPNLRTMHYAKITADDAVKAGVLAAEEIEDARATLPEKIFRELYYAEPGDDTGNPFGLEHIRACTKPELASGPVVAWGVDLAKSQDYLVCIGLNANGDVCKFARWRGLPWRRSIRSIWELVGEDTPCLVDSTGAGDPVLEELQYEHGNFMGYHFSPTSKQKLMEGLAVSIQSREITFPKGHISTELEMYEYVFGRTGVKYSAPEGQHDDCVCALALARQMWTEVAPGENVAKYYATQASKLREKEKQTIDGPTLVTEGFKVDFGEIVDNELQELYNETAGKLNPEFKRNCPVCGNPVVGASRVTDGEFFWHMECSNAANRQRFLAEALTTQIGESHG